MKKIVLALAGIAAVATPIAFSASNAGAAAGNSTLNCNNFGDNNTTVVSPRPTDNGPKGQAGQLTSTTPGATNIDKGILKTDFTAEVLDNVHGAGLKKGDHIVISQIGGTITQAQPDGSRANVTVAKAEHDPLLQVGDEEIVFLNQDSATGKFFTTGGGIGRFQVQSNGTVLAVDHDSPLARINNGKPARVLKSAVQAVP